MQEIGSDEKLEGAFREAVEHDTLVEFCKEHGVETTKEELKAFLDELGDEALEGVAELDDLDVSDVSGGRRYKADMP